MSDYDHSQSNVLNACGIPEDQHSEIETLSREIAKTMMTTTTTSEIVESLENILQQHTESPRKVFIAYIQAKSALDKMNQMMGIVHGAISSESGDAQTPAMASAISQIQAIMGTKATDHPTTSSEPEPAPEQKGEAIVPEDIEDGDEPTPEDSGQTYN